MKLNDHTIPPILRDQKRWDAVEASAREVMVETWRDFGVFCKFFLPKRFRGPYTSLHMTIIDLINFVLKEQNEALAKGKYAGRKMAVMGGRGCAKTSFCLHGLGAYRALFGISKFAVPITRAERNTTMHTDALRLSLTNSDAVKKIFGDVRSRAKALLPKGIDSPDGKTEFAIAVPPNHIARFLPIGVGGSIRGLGVNEGGDRPDLFLMDDIDDVKALRNPELTKFYHNDFIYGTILHGVNQYEYENTPWLICLMDTEKGENCFIEKVMGDPSWISVRVPVCDENWQTIDPNFRSQESLDAMVAEAKRMNALDQLAMELMCEPFAAENRPFHSEHFRYWAIEQDLDQANLAFGAARVRQAPDWRNPYLHHFVLVDPARTMNPRSDDTAIVGATVDLENPGVYVRTATGAGMTSDEMVVRAVDLVQELDAMFLCVEFHGLHLHLQPKFEEELIRRGMYHVTLMDMKPQSGKGEQSGQDNSKAARIIWGLSGWYSRGMVYHPTTGAGRLETQLLRMPSVSGKVDIADALGYLVQAMHTAGITFTTLPEVLDVRADENANKVVEMSKWREKRRAERDQQQRRRRMRDLHEQYDDNAELGFARSFQEV